MSAGQNNVKIGEKNETWVMVRQKNKVQQDEMHKGHTLKVCACSRSETCIYLKAI